METNKFKKIMFSFGSAFIIFGFYVLLKYDIPVIFLTTLHAIAPNTFTAEMLQSGFLNFGAYLFFLVGILGLANLFFRLAFKKTRNKGF